jgi:tetratricopeptide (TPR) repeat protein
MTANNQDVTRIEPLPLSSMEVPFVERSAEWRAMDSALDRAVRFEAPQVVTLIGPLGMGKSALVQNWLDDIQKRSVFRTVKAGRREGTIAARTTPERFAWLGSFLRKRIGLTKSMGQQTAMELFRGELQSVFGDRRVAEVAAFLGPFLGFELPESPILHALAGKPDSYADVARAVLCRFLEEDARLMPLVVVFEDLDVADEASLEMIASISREIGEAPMVIVCTARPELYVRHPEWGRWGGSHARVDLAPFDSRQIATLVASVLEGPADAALLERIEDESAGAPRAVLRVLEAYWRRGFVTKPTQQAAWRLEREDLPSLIEEISPEQAVVTRLASLSPAERDIVSRGAAFGTSFTTGGVIALGRLGSAPSDTTMVFAPDPSIEQTRQMLAALEARGYLQRRPESDLSGEQEWAFAVVGDREMLMGSTDPALSRSRRLFAAQWIEGRTGLAAAGDRFELLGSLYEAGGDERRAGECFVSAANRARDEGRLEQARTLYIRGVRMLDMGDSVFKMDALHQLGDVAARVGRTRESLSHFAEMLHIAWRLDLPAKGGAAHARIGRLHRTLGNYRLALRHLELGRLLFELAGDSPGLAASCDDIGRVHMLTGNLDTAMQHHRQALDLRESLGDIRGKSLTLSWLGLCEMQRGDLVQAGSCFAASLELAKREGDERAIAFALMDQAGVERELERPDRARSLLEEARKIVQGMSDTLTEAHLSIQIGECYLQAKWPKQAEVEFLSAKKLAEKFGTKRLSSQVERGLAEVKLAMMDIHAAHKHADAALRCGESIGVPTLIGAALRVMAQSVVAGALPDPDRGGAREMFDRALEVLNDRGSEMELRRTLVAYADFERKLGRRVASNELKDQAATIRARAHRPTSAALD